MSDRALAALTLAAALAFVLSPLVTGSFAGFEADAFPVPQDDPPVQPAGYAFAIWGVIYLWLVVHATFGLWRRASAPGWRAARPWLTASLAIGAFWIPVANASPVWASVMIWAMLLPALVALLRAGPEDPWLNRAPIGLYAGWLTAASVVSLGLLAGGYGLLGAAAAAWTALALAGGLAVVILGRVPSAAYAVAFAWAAIGVAVQNGVGAIGVAATLLALGTMGWTALRR